MIIAIDARIVFASTGRYVERLLHHLQEIDHDNEYLVLLLAKDYDHWRASSKNFKKIKADFPIYSVGEQLGFLRLLNSLKPDLVHFTMPQHPILYRGRFVCTIHDLTLVDLINKREGAVWRKFYSNTIKPRVFRLVFSSAVKRARALFVPTQYVAAQLKDRYGIRPKEVHVTPEAAEELAAHPTRPDFGQGKDFIMYLGNAYPYKNLGILVAAFRKLYRPDLKLVLGGKKDYFYEQLEQSVNADADGIIFAGFVPDDNLAWLYEHTQLYIFPSVSEGFGLPALEAMAYGAPVLSSNATCLPEVYGEAAEYFDPHNPDELAAKIEKLLDDPNRRQELSRLGRERVKRYSWRQMAISTLETYRKVG